MSYPDDPFWAMLEKHGLRPYIFSGVGPGWVPLIDQLITDMKAAGWKGYLDQIKEKYGTLRFYYTTTNECDHGQIERLVDQAEQKSGAICEQCGAPARCAKTSTGWYLTLCDICLERHEDGIRETR